MKKLAFAVTAVAALSGQALAADMPMKARPAPLPVAVASWTGCYVGGGGGYGLWQQENVTYDNTAAPAPRAAVTTQWDAGGRGYFGTVQGGCDYQFSTGAWAIVIGAFGDYDFADIKGRPSDPFSGFGGTEKLSSQWSVGGRIGALVTPSLLTYFTAGYTEAHFDAVNLVATSATNLFNLGPNVPTGLYVPGRTYKGWFIGAGDEYALSFLPGLFWKTEYRFSEMDIATNPVRIVGTGAPFGYEADSKKYIHTVRSELVYRFNFGGGAVVAKY